MATGIGDVLKELAPRIEMVRVQPAGASEMMLSRREHRAITTERTAAIADGVAAGPRSPRFSTISSSPPTTHCSCARSRSWQGCGTVERTRCGDCARRSGTICGPTRCDRAVRRKREPPTRCGSGSTEARVCRNSPFRAESQAPTHCQLTWNPGILRHVDREPTRLSARIGCRRALTPRPSAPPPPAARSAGARRHRCG